MAGTAVVGGHTWSTSSHVFYWTVETLADHATDPLLVEYLSAIATDNVGWLDVEEAPPASRGELLGLLRDLPELARRLLPASGEGRAAVISQVGELAALAGPPPA